LSIEVRDILKNYNATALFVTHNQYEAFAVADKIGVMHKGKCCSGVLPMSFITAPLTVR
jgi:iron(III) transport system ATP-binding protein